MSAAAPQPREVNSRMHQCSHAGCPVTSTATWWLDEHENQTHDRCQCGWSGIQLGHHIAAMRRKDPAGIHMSAPTSPSFI